MARDAISGARDPTLLERVLAAASTGTIFFNKIHWEVGLGGSVFANALDVRTQ